MLQKFYKSFADLIYPRACEACSNPLLTHESVLCLPCEESLPEVPFEAGTDNPVYQTFSGRLPLVFAHTFLHFSRGSLTQVLMHRFKYKSHPHIGAYLGKKFAFRLMKHPEISTVDALLPVPLHPTKEKKRGFNQSAIICRGMASVLHLPVEKNLMERLIPSDSQTLKNRRERWHNVSEIFKVKQPEHIKGKHILLVDDTLTTGATLEACGQKCLEAGAKNLSIATIALAR